MNYLPGGNLKQLIQRFGCLPEVRKWWKREYMCVLCL